MTPMLDRIARDRLLLLPRWLLLSAVLGLHASTNTLDDGNFNVIERFEAFEIGVDLDAGPLSNPFIVNASLASMEVAPPGATGKTIIMAPFFYQNFSRQQGSDGTEMLTRVGPSKYLLRFTPEQTGQYQFRLVGCSMSVSGLRSGSFDVVDSSRGPFVHVASGGQFFEAGGQPVFLLGENMVFPGRDPIITSYNYTDFYKYANQSTYMYDHYMKKMAAMGGNYIRLWIGLSCNATGSTPISLAGGTEFGRYDLAAAWRLDYILRLAESLNIKVLLCFESQQSLQMLFPASIYTKDHGGPLSVPTDYFSNQIIRNEFKNRLTYAINRYSSSTALLSWQFFNEWNDFPGFSTDIAVDWQAQLSQFVRETDPYSHLIHNSFGSITPEQFTQTLDFATLHSYNVDDFGLTAMSTLSTMQSNFSKPVFWGETGFSGGAHGGDINGSLWWTADAPSVHLHNALWGSVVSTAAGGAMHWWWHEFDDHNAYLEFSPVRKFVDQIPLLSRRWESTAISPIQPGPSAICSKAPGQIGYHFDTKIGHVLKNFNCDNNQTRSVDWCHQQCCDVEGCDGWVFTKNQTGSTSGTCKLGGRCCWLKAGVNELVPGPTSCTSGLARKMSASVSGMVMKGYNPNNHTQTQLTVLADIFAMWVRNTAHTWRNQFTGAGSQEIESLPMVLSSIRPGNYNILVFNTTDGSTVSSIQAVANTTCFLSFQLPSFVSDVAVIGKVQNT